MCWHTTYQSSEHPKSLFVSHLDFLVRIPTETLAFGPDGSPGIVITRCAARNTMKERPLCDEKRGYRSWANHCKRRPLALLPFFSWSVLFLIVFSTLSPLPLRPSLSVRICIPSLILPYSTFLPVLLSFSFSFSLFGLSNTQSINPSYRVLCIVRHGPYQCEYIPSKHISAQDETNA